jgi:hypothetical protein
MQHRSKKNGRSWSGQMTWRDYFMLANMILFLVVGTLMLYRSFSQNAPWMTYLMGLGFISAGGYRLYLFCSVLMQRSDKRIDA